MRSSLPKCLGLAALFLSAGFLFAGATTFALAKANPVSGRTRGCYTVLALILGAKEAAGWDWTRLVELVVALILFTCAVALSIAWLKSR